MSAAVELGSQLAIPERGGLHVVTLAPVEPVRGRAAIAVVGLASLGRFMRPLANHLDGLGLNTTVLGGPNGINTVVGMPSKIIDLAEELYEASGGPVEVVGHSWGGRSAVKAAEHRPELFRHVVAYGSPVADLDGPEYVTTVGSTGDLVVLFPATRNSSFHEETLYQLPSPHVHPGLLLNRKGFAKISQALAEEQLAA